MGDNAKRGWEWHNTVVGEGYQAKGVIRQKTADNTKQPPTSFIDYSIDKSQLTNNADIKKESKTRSKEKTEKKQKKDKKDRKKDSKKKKSKHDKSDKAAPSQGFNPLMQLLATRLSNKTMHFSETNQ